MTRTMTVDLQCPSCDDGTLTATVDPDSITDLTDAGCGHAEGLWATLGPALLEAIWEAVEEAGARRYDAAQESRFAAWRDA